MAKKPQPQIIDDQPQAKEDVRRTDLAEHAEARYLEYSISVVKGRAIPAIEDGLKPVQRRILFAMKNLNLHHTSKPMKSARVVGDVLGKYHPHGDSSVYDAMVRTSQNFALRYPLVVGQGNFGSRDGDGAAAMRYTEAHLSAFASTFLSELDMGTVDMKLTYDNSTEEPELLPSRLPNILLNGASGIAVGIATEIPSHNLVETVDAAIAVIKNPKLTLEDILKIMPGPDYATGGQIISSPEEIHKIYSDKRGSVRVRARYKVEGEGTKNWKLVFYELPQSTSSQKIMEEIDALINPKPKDKKGKKVFSEEQLRLKGMFGALFDIHRDESNKNSPVRLTIEPRSPKQDPHELATAFLAHTSMESNCPVNLMMVGRDKAPGAKSLDGILREWTEFRIDTVHRRTSYEHKIASRRLHILQGRVLVLDHIEEVVKIIKSSDDAKAALMARFGLSEEQAEDVMEIRLRQLARLERQKILDEMKALEDEIRRLEKLLESKTAMKNQVIKELEADKKLFGDQRRTLIEPAERTLASAIHEQAASDDPVTVAISERGWIRAKAGHQHGKEAFAFKSGDSVQEVFKATMAQHVIFFDEAGKSYSQAIRDLPTAKGGEDVPIATLADFSGSKLAHVLIPKAADKIILASDSGYGFICSATDLVSRMKAGKAIVKLDAGAKMLRPLAFDPAVVDAQQTVFSTLSSNGRMLCYRLSEISELAKGKGTALCGLDPDAKRAEVAFWPHNEVSIQIEGLKKPTVLSIEEMAKHVQGRSSSKKGRPLEAAKGRKATFAVKAPPATEE